MVVLVLVAVKQYVSVQSMDLKNFSLLPNETKYLVSGYIRNTSEHLFPVYLIQMFTLFYFVPKPPIDECCPYQDGFSVLEDLDDGVIYDAKLNQTNIGNNNNKFYILQVIQKDGANEFYYHFRWARVGYKGMCKTAQATKDECIATFKKKFYDKTLNDWEERHSFEARPRKYTYLPLDYFAEYKFKTTAK
eukprot:1151997_1